MATTYNNLLTTATPSTGDGTFIAEYGVTTYAEISGALVNNKMVFVKYSSTLFEVYAPVVLEGNLYYGYTFMTINENITYKFSVNSNNQWSMNSYSLDCVFFAVLGSTTRAEIKAAYLANKLLVAKYSDYGPYYYLRNCSIQTNVGENETDGSYFIFRTPGSYITYEYFGGQTIDVVWDSASETGRRVDNTPHVMHATWDATNQLALTTTLEKFEEIGSDYGRYSSYLDIEKSVVDSLGYTHVYHLIGRNISSVADSSNVLKAVYFDIRDNQYAGGPDLSGVYKVDINYSVYPSVLRIVKVN